MKLSRLFGAGMAAMALLAAGCSNDPAADRAGAQDNSDGSLKITIAGDAFVRAAGPSSTAQENAVKKFTVYVFNAENDALEDSQTFTGVNTGTVSGLSTGFPKKIIVLANTPANFPVLYTGDDISKLTAAQAAINLTYQTPANIATNGLVMLGETDAPLNLNLTGSTDVTIHLRRVAAKVTLGTIEVLPLGDYDLEKFDITGVSIQRAISATDIYGNALTSSSLFGGQIGSMSLTQQSFLYDALNADFEVGVGQNMGNYFYVLPNADAAKSTLLTLSSTYNGDPQHFPIPINTQEGDENTDGTMIVSNKSYIINIVINNLGEGTTDPDVPPLTASIDVEVIVDPWDVDIVQNVTW